MFKETSKRKTVKEIKKRERVSLRISKCELGGFPYVEIRQYYLDTDGEFKPSKKGVSFVPELLDDVIDGLVLVRKEYRESKTGVSKKKPTDTL